MHSRFSKNDDGRYVAAVVKRGRDIVRDPLINKGSAFTSRERAVLGLEGLLPPGVTDIEQQKLRVKEAMARLEHPLSKATRRRSKATAAVASSLRVMRLPN